MKMGVEKGRSTRKDLKIGICGEHGGDPASVVFCHSIGLDYVSCSPFRVPIARLAAPAAIADDASDSRPTLTLGSRDDPSGRPRAPVPPALLLVRRPSHRRNDSTAG